MSNHKHSEQVFHMGMGALFFVSTAAIITGDVTMIVAGSLLALLIGVQQLHPASDVALPELSGV
jgi:hypothetical protein